MNSRIVTVRRHLSVVAVTVGLALGVLLVGPATGSATAAEAYWRIVNNETGRCLDSTATGLTGTNPCNGGNYQNWYMRGNSDGTMTIVDRATGWCLDATSDGRVGTNPCNGGNYQHWYESLTSGKYAFRQRATSRYLQEIGGAVVTNPPIFSGDVNTQRWWI